MACDGGDLAEIETVKPYSEDYNSVVDQGQREVNRRYMPEIKPLEVDIQAYDRIILGSPVWWYTFAPAMKTFAFICTRYFFFCVWRKNRNI